LQVGSFLDAVQCLNDANWTDRMSADACGLLRLER
jgi:hypothetical protein